jgi:hypothetical protein
MPRIFRAIGDEFKRRFSQKDTQPVNTYEGFDAAGRVRVRDRRGTVKAEIPDVDLKSETLGDERHLRHMLLSYMKILQRSAHTLITEQGCSDTARCPGRRAHSLLANLGRIASPIRPNLIFDRDRCGMLSPVFGYNADPLGTDG